MKTWSCEEKLRGEDTRRSTDRDPMSTWLEILCQPGWKSFDSLAGDPMSTLLSSVRSDPPNTAVLSLSGVSLQSERPADARSLSPLSGSPRPQSASRRLPRMRTDPARGPGHNGGLLGRAAVAGEYGVGGRERGGVHAGHEPPLHPGPSRTCTCHRRVHQIF